VKNDMGWGRAKTESGAPEPIAAAAERSS